MTWIIENTIIATVLAGIAFCVARYSRPRPAVVHVLWLLVLVKLVCPPIFDWSVPVAAPTFLEFADATAANAGDATASPGTATPGTATPRNAATPSAHAPSATAPNAVTSTGRHQHEIANLTAAAKTLDAAYIDRLPIAELEPRAPSGDTASSPTIGNPASWPSSIWTWLAFAWGVGALFMLIPSLWGIYRVQRMIGLGTVAPAWLRDEASALARSLGVKVPELRIVPGIQTAFVWSVGRPVIAWPMTSLDRSDLQRLRSVLAHELAHLRRRDHWVARFEIFAATVLWWHPLFWFARSRMRLQAELACDAWAVWAVPKGRTAYAGALIDAIEKDPSSVDALPALGVWSGAGRAFEERLTMILHSEVPRRLSGWATAALATLSLTLFSGVSFAQSRGEQSSELEKRIEKRVKEVLKRHGYDEQDPKTDKKKTRKSKRSRGLSSQFDKMDSDELRELMRAIERRLEGEEKKDRKPRKSKGKDKSKSKGKSKRRAKGSSKTTFSLGGKGFDFGNFSPDMRKEMKAGLAEARREIMADKDLRKMGLTDDVLGLIEGVIGGGGMNEDAFQKGIQGVVGKAIKHGLNEARIELKAEGIDNPEFLADIGKMIEVSMKGGDVSGLEKSLENSMKGMIGGMVKMGLAEAQKELQKEGIDNPEFLGQLGGLIETAIEGGDTDALEEEIERSLGGFIEGAIKHGLSEAVESADSDIEVDVIRSVEKAVGGAVRGKGKGRKKSQPKFDEERLEKMLERLLEKTEKHEKKSSKRLVR